MPLQQFTTDKGTIRPGSYPYVNARVRAMRAKLLEANDYRKLQNMSVPEIAEFLQKQDYKDEINQLGSDHEGKELLEQALQLNLTNTYSKLIDISPGEVQQLLRAYFRKFEIEDIKALLRKQIRGQGTATSRERITPQSEEVEELAQIDSLDELLSEIELPGGGTMLIDLVDSSSGLQEMEEVLDRDYFQQMGRIADRLSSAGKLFKEFLQLEIELRNISLILRMKKGGYDRSDISDHLIELRHGRREIDHKELLDAESYSDAVERLREVKLGRYITSTDIAQVERALDKYKLERGGLMLHKHPLSINPILGYMVAKETEIQNLHIITQAKAAELGDDFVENNIIYEVRER